MSTVDSASHTTHTTSKVSLPIEIQQTIFYMLHNRGDRKTSAVFLRLDKEAYNYYRPRFDHTIILTHTNSAKLTKYLFADKPDDRVIQAVRRIFITSLPNDHNIHSKSNLDIWTEEDAVEAGVGYEAPTGPFRHLETVVISHDLILDAYLASALTGPLNDGSDDDDELPAVSSPISSLIRKIMTTKVDVVGTAQPITLCCTQPDLWSDQDLDDFLTECPVVLPPYYFSKGPRHSWLFPKHVTASHIDEGLFYLLQNLTSYISGGFHFIQHDAGSLFELERMQLISSVVEFKGKSRSYRHHIDHDNISEARRFNMDHAAMDSCDPVSHHIDTQRVVLSNYWLDARDGWLEECLKEKGWKRKASEKEDEHIGKKGEGTWERRRGDQVLEIYREAPATWCGCREDSIGGALPTLKGRFRGSC